MIPRMKIAVTRSCQLKCFYCGGSEGTMENFESIGRPPLSVETVRRVLRAYASAGGKGILLTGGEPLLHPELHLILEEIAATGLPWEVTTNGLELDVARVELLSRFQPTMVKVSMDTADPVVYTEVTGRDALMTLTGHLSAAVSVLPIRLNAVVTRRTLNGIPALIGFARRLGLKGVWLLDLVFYPEACQSKAASFDFETEYIDLQNAVAPFLSKTLGLTWKPADWYDLSKVYSYADFDDGFRVAIKHAKETTRVEVCDKCPTLCQEGAFILRLSAGGWLNFCPIENENGLAITSDTTSEELIEIFTHYGDLFDTTHVVNTWKHFLARIHTECSAF